MKRISITTITTTIIIITTGNGAG
ncbi:thr operon leader peptide [Leclercia adecarboxylata]|nr:thr operon leader peptide [Leclercia adecarboxylata]MCZ7840403.1 thr operon leader peptide [Leclercia adecarboxylata]